MVCRPFSTLHAPTCGGIFMNKINVRRLVIAAMCIALSVALIAVIHLPIIPAAAWLEYDPADIPLMLLGFLFGPLWALLATAAACAIQALTVSAGSGIIGFCMHFFATGLYVCVSGILYRVFKRGFRGAVWSTILAFAAACLIMIPLNLIFTPMYGVPLEMVKELLFPAILPFNIIKFGANSAITLVLYRLVYPTLLKSREV